MARFTSALLRLTTTDLWKIALALRPDSGGRTYDWGRHDGRTIPVVWRALPIGGRSGQADHTDLLKQVLNVIDASSIEEVLADREFISTGWLRQMQQRGIPFRIRLRSDRRIGDSEEGPALPARMFARPLNSGTERVLDGERYLSGGEGAGFQLDAVCRRPVHPPGRVSAGQNPRTQRVEPVPLRTGPPAEYLDHTRTPATGVLRMPAGSSKSDCVFGMYLATSLVFPLILGHLLQREPHVTTG
jgi:hypothetical protein